MEGMCGNRQTTFSKWRSPFPTTTYYMVVFVFISIHSILCDHETAATVSGNAYYAAKVNITYYKGSDAKPSIMTREMGKYATKSEKSTNGQLIHVLTNSSNNRSACGDIINGKSHNWIALVERGECEFEDKIKNIKRFNATGIIIYDNQPPKAGYTRAFAGEKSFAAVFLTQKEGRQLLSLFESKKDVYIDIQRGNYHKTDPTTSPPGPHNISKTSVLFVSISFIVLMIISLAWLVFYYIQRFRYAHAKERLTRRLANAAKKAIAKIPQRTIKSGDRELEMEFDQCAVCIEAYKTSDVIRILPCKHIFHKSCVDPWLLDQRSCPMCKLDILREYGMQVHIGGSQETVHAEGESGGTGSGIADDPEQLSSPDEHHHHDSNIMNIVLIQHPPYYGSDTFCEESEVGPSERSALNPQPIECHTDIIQGDIDLDSESECTEMNSLMTGLPRKGSSCDISPQNPV